MTVKEVGWAGAGEGRGGAGTANAQYVEPVQSRTACSAHHLNASTWSVCVLHGVHLRACVRGRGTLTKGEGQGGHTPW